MALPPPPALSTPRLNLMRLTIMRGITWTGFLLVVIFGIEVMGFQLNVLSVMATILFMAAFNVVTWWRLGLTRPVSDLEYTLHLIVDLLGLTCVFFQTGGATNPAVTYLLVPITIAAATLPWWHTITTALVAILGYTLLMFFYVPLPQLDQHFFNLPFSLHIVGMWLNFILCAALMTYFIYKMARALRLRDHSLSQTREAALRNEQILAVASQAALTAHELGTPLSTIAVLLTEMRRDITDPLLQEDLDMIRCQVDTCKQHLRALAARAERKASRIETQDAQQWIANVIERWLVMRPDVEYGFEIRGRRSAQIDVDITLGQAVMNLLNNAADASPDQIKISLDWNEHTVTLDIRDYGAGIPMDIADKLGETFVTSRSKGMGIGLFLTHATINRFGGSVKLYNQDGGGTLTEVTLPRAGTLS